MTDNWGSLARGLVLVVPALMALAAALSFVVKAMRKKGSAGKKATWEAYIGTLGLTQALLGAMLLADAEDRHRELDGFLNEVRRTTDTGISYIKEGTPQQVHDLLLAVVDELQHASGLRVSRTIFHPLGLPGYAGESDRLVGQLFKAVPFPLEILVGFPDSAAGKASADLSGQAQAMEQFAFRYLTSPEWTEMAAAAYVDRVRILYLPWQRQHESWIVTTDTLAYGGFEFLSGSWGADGACPCARTGLRMSGQTPVTALRDEHRFLSRKGVSYMEAQLNLPTEEREPIMVFAVGGPGRVLRPMTAVALRDRIEERLAAWTASAGSLPLPARLERLKALGQISNLGR